MFKNSSLKLLFALGISPLFIFLISGCKNKDLDLTQTTINTEDVDNIEAVAALGQLNPLGEIRKLAAPNSGKGGIPRLSKLLIQEGESILKGQVLAVFDNRPKLEANLESAQANLNILISEISIKKREIERYQNLFDKGAVAKIVLDKMKDDLFVSDARVSKLESDIEAIKVDLEQSQLKSPIDGIVLQILVREGERPNSNGVINVGANQLMEALIEVYESDIDRVKMGQTVDLISENGGFIGSLSGRVSLISPQVRQRRVLSTDPTGDADSRIVEVRVKLDNPSAKKVSHLTGMKVIARFQP